MEGSEQKDTDEIDNGKSIKIRRLILYINIFLAIYLAINMTMLFIQYPSIKEYWLVLNKAGYLFIYLKIIAIILFTDAILFLSSKIFK